MLERRRGVLLVVVVMSFGLDDAKRLPSREESFVMTLEPKVDDCPNFDNAFLTSHDLVFKKLDRYTIAMSGFLNLTEKIEAPISAIVTADKLHMGSYIKFLVTTQNDVCREIGREGMLWSNVMTKINVTSCPIHPQVFIMDQLTVTLDDTHLGPEHTGRYKCKVLLHAIVNGEPRPVFCQIFYSRVDKG